MVQTRLDGLSGESRRLLRAASIFGERFSAADLMMTTVLRMLRDTDLVEQRPALAAYRRRGEARPAFKKALDAQLGAFAKHAPAAAPR